MLLASSHPHDDFSINGLRDRIELQPMHLPCHRVVLTEAAVDGRIVVRLEQVLWVIGDVGLCRPVVGQSPCLDLGARLATM